jgi:hypothetical protein
MPQEFDCVSPPGKGGGRLATRFAPSARSGEMAISLSARPSLRCALFGSAVGTHPLKPERGLTMTALGFLQASRVAKPANTVLKILEWVYQNNAYFMVFFLLGLVDVVGMKHFLSFGATIAEYNQF